MINQPSTNEQMQNLRNNIELLGGMEDTITTMQESLNNFEIRNLLNKNIQTYPNPFIPKPLT